MLSSRFCRGGNARGSALENGKKSRKTVSRLKTTYLVEHAEPPGGTVWPEEPHGVRPGARGHGGEAAGHGHGGLGRAPVTLSALLRAAAG